MFDQESFLCLLSLKKKHWQINNVPLTAELVSMHRKYEIIKIVTDTPKNNNKIPVNAYPIFSAKIILEYPKAI